MTDADSEAELFCVLCSEEGIDDPENHRPKHDDVCRDCRHSLKFWHVKEVIPIE